MATSPPTASDSLRKMRHDIRNSLNSIMLTVEVLNMPLDNVAETVDFLDGLIRATERMSGLLEGYPYEEAEQLNAQPK